MVNRVVVVPVPELVGQIWGMLFLVENVVGIDSQVVWALLDVVS